MKIREATFAGSWYPDSAAGCKQEIKGFLKQAKVPSGSGKTFTGGIVPHAGWMFSGAVAAEVIAVLTAGRDIETFVIFGAVHRFSGTSASAYASGAWRTPLGEIAIDEELAAVVVQGGSIVTDSPAAHDDEHSIEVQVPLVQHLAPSARLLPVMVPPTASAHEVGRLVAERANEVGREVAFLGSTDLTHYGPRYQFTPMGLGSDALAWAKEVNDRRVVDLMVGLRAEAVVAEAAEHRNACGGGAVAAGIRACQTCGADTGRLLRHTTSNEAARERYGEMADAVGYAGVVFSRRAGSTE